MWDIPYFLDISFCQNLYLHRFKALNYDKIQNKYITIKDINFRGFIMKFTTQSKLFYIKWLLWNSTSVLWLVGNRIHWVWFYRLTRFICVSIVYIKICDWNGYADLMAIKIIGLKFYLSNLVVIFNSTVIEVVTVAGIWLIFIQHHTRSGQSHDVK